MSFTALSLLTGCGTVTDQELQNSCLRFIDYRLSIVEKENQSMPQSADLHITHKHKGTFYSKKYNACMSITKIETTSDSGDSQMYKIYNENNGTEYINYGDISVEVENLDLIIDSLSLVTLAR